MAEQIDKKERKQEKWKVRGEEKERGGGLETDNMRGGE